MGRNDTLGRAMVSAVNRELADRKSAGDPYPITDLARDSGIKYRTLSRRLSGESDLLPDEFEALAHALGIPVDRLWKRARAIQDEPDDPRLEGMSPEAADRVRKVREEYRPSSERPRRAANG